MRHLRCVAVLSLNARGITSSTARPAPPQATAHRDTQIRPAAQGEWKKRTEAGRPQFVPCAEQVCPTGFEVVAFCAPKFQSAQVAAPILGRPCQWTRPPLCRRLAYTLVSVPKRLTRKRPLCRTCELYLRVFARTRHSLAAACQLGFPFDLQVLNKLMVKGHWRRKSGATCSMSAACCKVSSLALFSRAQKGG